MSQYNPTLHHRRSIRSKGYDYSKEGLYFLTCCCQNREHFFGEIVEGEMFLNEAGEMICEVWETMPERFKNITLHEFIVMPNHFHAVVEIVRATLVVAQNPANQTRESGPGIGEEDGRGEGERRGRGQGQPQGIAPTMDGGIDPTMDGEIASTIDRITPSNDGIALTNESNALKAIVIGDLVSAFKSITTVKYIAGVKNNGWKRFDGKLWQRNYYEHIIRHDIALANITNYIMTNPKKWEEDRFKSFGRPLWSPKPITIQSKEKK